MPARSKSFEALVPSLASVLLGLFLASTTASSEAPRRDAAQPLDPRRVPLTDQKGSQFTIDGLRGRPIVVTFVATTCDDACPLINAWFARLQRRLLRRHLKATLLSITLDPEFDTPAVMGRLGRTLGADPSVWRFSSGSVDGVRSILRAFRVTMARDARGLPDEHTTFVYILDRNEHLAETLLASSHLSDDVIAALDGGRLADR